MVLEFLDGPSLSRLRRAAKTAGKPLPLAMELLILSEALNGLHAAHELKSYEGVALNVVHRDFTPQNLMITYSGQVKIVDFGIAKALDNNAETSAGFFKGKLTYVPPEQLLGNAVDRRTDIFAAGVMLFEAIAGASPWDGMNNAAITHGLASGNVPLLMENKASSEHPQLAAICDQAMAVDADARFSTAHEFKKAIDEYAKPTHFLQRTQSFQNSRRPC
jgi:eukaryotic-like serine/threonine-protein kinase